MRADYLKEAKKIYDWERKMLFDQETGAVRDNMNQKGEVNPAVYTYNPGTFMGAAYELYKATGDSQYMADAVKAADYVLDRMTDNNGVLSDAPHGDGGLFHGIFFRYFVKWVNEPALDNDHRTKLREFMTRCATTLVDHGLNRNTMLYGGKWWEAPADDASVCLTAQLTGCMLMEAMCVMK